MQTHFDFLREVPEACPKAEWDAVARVLQAAGVPYRQAIAAAKGANLLPQDVRELLAVFHKNARVFRGPEAVLYRLANGHWPEPRLSSDEYERRRWRLWRKRERDGFSREMIESEIARRLPGVCGHA